MRAVQQIAVRTKRRRARGAGALRAYVRVGAEGHDPDNLLDQHAGLRQRHPYLVDGGLTKCLPEGLPGLQLAVSDRRRRDRAAGKIAALLAKRARRSAGKGSKTAPARAGVETESRNRTEGKIYDRRDALPLSVGVGRTAQQFRLRDFSLWLHRIHRIFAPR